MASRALSPEPQAAIPSQPFVAQNFPSVARGLDHSYFHSHFNSRSPGSWLPPTPPQGLDSLQHRTSCHPMWG